MHQAVYMENCFNYFVMEYPLFDNIRWNSFVIRRMCGAIDLNSTFFGNTEFSGVFARYKSLLNKITITLVIHADLNYHSCWVLLLPWMSKTDSHCTINVLFKMSKVYDISYLKMFWYQLLRSNKSRRGRDRMIVGSATTKSCAISALHHKVVISNPALGEVHSVQHYVIQFDLRKVAMAFFGYSGFLQG